MPPLSGGHTHLHLPQPPRTSSHIPIVLHLVSQKGVRDAEEGLAPRAQLPQRDAKRVAGREGDGGAGERGAKLRV